MAQIGNTTSGFHPVVKGKSYVLTVALANSATEKQEVELLASNSTEDAEGNMLSMAHIQTESSKQYPFVAISPYVYVNTGNSDVSYNISEANFNLSLSDTAVGGGEGGLTMEEVLATTDAKYGQLDGDNQWERTNTFNDSSIFWGDALVLNSNQIVFNTPIPEFRQGVKITDGLQTDTISASVGSDIKLEANIVSNKTITVEPAINPNNEYLKISANDGLINITRSNVTPFTDTADTIYNRTNNDARYGRLDTVGNIWKSQNVWSAMCSFSEILTCNDGINVTGTAMLENIRSGLSANTITTDSEWIFTSTTGSNASAISFASAIQGFKMVVSQANWDGAYDALTLYVTSTGIWNYTISNSGTGTRGGSFQFNNVVRCTNTIVGAKLTSNSGQLLLRYNSEADDGVQLAEKDDNRLLIYGVNVADEEGTIHKFQGGTTIYVPSADQSGDTEPTMLEKDKLMTQGNCDQRYVLYKEMTSAEFQALTVKNAGTLYCVIGEGGTNEVYLGNNKLL